MVLQGLGRVQCDGGGLSGPGSACYRPTQPPHLDDSRSVRSDDGDARPGSGSRSDLNDSHCGLGDDSDAGIDRRAFSFTARRKSIARYMLYDPVSVTSWCCTSRSKSTFGEVIGKITMARFFDSQCRHTVN